MPWVQFPLRTRNPVPGLLEGRLPNEAWVCPRGPLDEACEGTRRHTRARRQTEDTGCCREGVRREDEHPGPPPQQQ